MKAVDAAIGPKVDENELVFELIAEGERLRIQPSVSPRELFDFELLNIRQTISYFFEVFHRVRIRLGKVLITQIDVALCEDVTVAIVVSVLSQLIGKTLRVVKDLRAIIIISNFSMNNIKYNKHIALTRVSHLPTGPSPSRCLSFCSYFRITFLAYIVLVFGML